MKYETMKVLAQVISISPYLPYIVEHNVVWLWSEC